MTGVLLVACGGFVNMGSLVAAGLSGHMIGGGQHLAAGRLKIDFGQQKAGRYPFHHAPLPDCGGVEVAARRQPASSLVRIALQKFDGIYAIEQPCRMRLRDILPKRNEKGI